MKYLATLFFLFQTIFLFGQDQRLDRETLPAYLIQGESDTLGIVFAINDVQKIDTKLELLEHLEKLNSKLDTTLFYYVSLTNSQNDKIKLLTHKVVNLTSQKLKNEDIIINLREELRLSNDIIMEKDVIISIKDRVIKEYEKELNKEKTKFNLTAILVIILVVVMGVL